MYERQVELSVGQTLQVGDVLLTIVDIEAGEIHFRLDDGETEEACGERRSMVLALPR